MPNLNALKAVKNVQKRLVDYCIEEHFVKEYAFRNACRAIWEGPPEGGGLVGDLWVEGTFPNVTCGPSLSQRVGNGTFNETLANRIDVNRGFGINWTPRSIQTESLDFAQEGYKADNKPAIVVTAGTGAGKTEAFLLPMLNDLFGRQATMGEGVSAIILYPMNALVKDQVDRMHSWLKGQDQVRMFSFTGATPHKHGRPHFTDGCRFSSREEARGLGIINQGGNFIRQVVPGYRPPEILVTNYSMLEYMLARPQDHVFFGNNLRTIVLDEAHLYRGNLAADISLLLRRLYLRCRVSANDVVQFATSATIGKDGETGKRQLQEFAGSLFSKDAQQVHVILGRAAEESAFSATASDFQINSADLQAISPPAEATLTADDPPQFHQSTKWQEWRDYCQCLFGEHETATAFNETDGRLHIAPVLHHLLPYSQRFQTLYHTLFQNGSPRRIRLPDLAEMVLGDSSDQNIECVRRMLELGAIARSEPGSMPLIPNRIHALFRAPDGLSFRFDPVSYKANTRLNIHGFVFSPSRIPAQMDDDGGISLTLCRCMDSGLWFLAGVEDARQRIGEVPLHLIDRDQMADADELDDGDERAIGERIRFFQIDDVGGHIWLDPQDGQVSATQGNGHIQLREYNECPVANVPLIKRARFFTSPTRLTLSIIAETLLAEMPTFPGASAAILPGGGRRLIAFSDSRREAARLGPSLQSQHEQQILRAVIARVFSEVLGTRRREIDIQLFALRQARGIGTAPSPIDPIIEGLEQEIQRMSEGISLDDFVNRIHDRREFDQVINDATRNGHSPSGWVNDWNQNLQAVHSDAFLKRRVGIELARRPSWPGLTTETTGLIEIIYPGIEELQIPDAIGQMGNPQGREMLTQEWPTFLKLLCDEIRNRGAITVDPNIDSENYMGKWARFDGEGDGVRMLPANNHENTRMGRFLLSLCNRIGFAQDWQTATALLQIAFWQLVEAASKPEFEWLELRLNANANFRIDFGHLRFREPVSLYRCERTGQIWNHSLLGLAPSRSEIELVEVKPTELDEDSLVGRRRREWRQTGDSDVFSVGLWAEEHSGQLDVKENERIQNLFKAGMRNILSSTTTLELGIDIGGLSGVIMGNIPPGKANYLQRAGRAGRRADGSSLVCSFAKASPYERQAFLAFDQYIERDLPPPTIHLHREKILLSHLHMHLLSEFLRSQNMGDVGAMQAFGKMGPFTARQVPARWNQLNQIRSNWDRPDGGGPSEDCLASKFIANLETLRLDPPSNAVRILCKEIQELESRWPDILDEAEFRFSAIVEDWCDRFDKLGEVWNGQGNDEQDQRACNAIRHEGVAMANTHVIEELGNGLFIPRYGFPINVMRLHVRRYDQDDQDDQETTDERDDNRFKLERDCTMAIREYAPGSQVLAGGHRVTSHGILKHWTGQNVGGDHNAMLSRGRWMSGGNGFNVEMGYDGNPQQNAFKHLLFPKHGFTTAEWDPARRAYSLESVGKALMKTDAFNHQPDRELHSELRLGLDCWHVEGGQLFVLNQGSYDLGFAVCLKCGFSESEKEEGWGDDSLPRRFDQHRSIFSNRKCWNIGENPKLRHQVLAARQISNLLVVDFSPYVDNADVAFTLAQALRLAGSQLLHLDYREIRSLEQISGFAKPQGYGVVLYDTLSGGSGHLEELSKMGNQWLQAAMTLLTVEGASCNEWREREAILRLLTSDVRDFEADYKFKPLETLEVLRQIQSGQALDPQDDPKNNAQIPADVWTFDRLALCTPDGPFVFSHPLDKKIRKMVGDVAGTVPLNGTFCIVEMAGKLDCGKWCFSEKRMGGKGNTAMFFRLIGSVTIDSYRQLSPEELPKVIAVEEVRQENI